MRTLFILIVAGLVGGGAGYLVPVERAVEDEQRLLGATTFATSTATSASADGAQDRTAEPSESAERLVAGIVACGAREDTRMAVLLPDP